MEVWKDIEKYEGLYQISNLGRVRSLDRIVPHKRHGFVRRKGKVLKLTGNKGYKLVILQKEAKSQTISVHRLVAQAFLENSLNKPHVCHKDDNTKNNEVSNLFWGTHQDNMDDKKRKGRHVFGEHPSKKAIKCIETGEVFASRNEASQKLNIARSSISRILKGLQESSQNLSFEYVENI